MTGCEVPTADVIVLARVVSLDMGQSDRPMVSEPWGRVKVTLTVSERFRGNAGDHLVVATEPLTVSCGYPFEVGHDYLVFASRHQGRLTVSYCSATRPAKAAASRIRQLRALRDGTALPDLFGFVGTHPDALSADSRERIQPMPGLTVVAKSQLGEYQTVTAEDGTYEFRGVPAGRYQVSVKTPRGRVALSAGGERWATNAGIGTPCPIDFFVFWDSKITGMVVDKTGIRYRRYHSRIRRVGEEADHICHSFDSRGRV